jgi:hypothetical protein
MSDGGEPRRVCFTPDEVRGKCSANSGFYCMTGNAPWDADAGFTCPGLIGAPGAPLFSARAEAGQAIVS